MSKPDEIRLANLRRYWNALQRFESGALYKCPACNTTSTIFWAIFFHTFVFFSLLWAQLSVHWEYTRKRDKHKIPGRWGKRFWVKEVYLKYLLSIARSVVDCFFSVGCWDWSCVCCGCCCWFVDVVVVVVVAVVVVGAAVVLDCCCWFEDIFTLRNLSSYLTLLI